MFPNNKSINKNKGSVSFVFYFILVIALLAVAGYYIGINEQTKLFKDIASKKQQQLDGTPMADPNAGNQSNNNSNLAGKQDMPIKSLIDSPSVVLRNIRNAKNSVNQASNNNNNGGSTSANAFSFDYGINVDKNSDEVNKMIVFAKQAEYTIKTNQDKGGVNIKLTKGEAVGNSCYNEQSGRVCFPKYKLDEIWSIGDLNGDGVNDSVISVSATENLTTDKLKTNNFYAMMSASSSVASTSLNKASSSIVSKSSSVSTSTVLLPKSSVTSTSSLMSTSSLVATSTATSSVVQNPAYTIAPFNFGLYSPLIVSAEISEGNVVLIGNFYANGDALGKPSVNKSIKYKFTNNLIQKVSEAKLFKEQGESTSLWYSSNYTSSGLDFAFKVPETWKKEESFDNGDVRIIFTNTDGRSLVLQTKSIIETCAEYNFNLNDSTDAKVKSSEYIDLGAFGVGSYIKYGIIGTDSNQYHADICVSDKNNDRKIFSLYSTSKEDSDPYFSIFDKIWSTFTIKQNTTN